MDLSHQHYIESAGSFFVPFKEGSLLLPPNPDAKLPAAHAGGTCFLETSEACEFDDDDAVSSSERNDENKMLAKLLDLGVPHTEIMACDPAHGGRGLYDLIDLLDDYETMPPMEPRQIVITVVTARGQFVLCECCVIVLTIQTLFGLTWRSPDVPVRTKPPKGGGVYLSIEFEDQVHCTSIKTWGENVVLDTSQTFGIIHESRFFDWGERFVFNLSDMDRVVREGTAGARVKVFEFDPVAESERKRLEQDRLAALEAAEQERVLEEEEEKRREESRLRELEERRSAMTMAELREERKAERRRRQRAEERERQRQLDAFERQRVFEESRPSISQGNASSHLKVGPESAREENAPEKTEDAEEEEEEYNLIGSGLVPSDLMTKVACTVIGWEGEGAIGLTSKGGAVMDGVGLRQSAVKAIYYHMAV